MAHVLLKNLNKSFDGTHAVKDVNLEIRDHEFVVLVGPSGCGKTTTLRMVAGLEDITSGEISVAANAISMVFHIHRLNSVSCTRFLTWSSVGCEVQNGEYSGWFQGR